MSGGSQPINQINEKIEKNMKIIRKMSKYWRRKHIIFIHRVFLLEIIIAALTILFIRWRINSLFATAFCGARLLFATMRRAFVTGGCTYCFRFRCGWYWFRYMAMTIDHVLFVENIKWGWKARKRVRNGWQNRIKLYV